MLKVMRERTDYHELRILETSFAEERHGRFRVLQFADGAEQGVLDLDHPRRIVLAYPRALIHLIDRCPDRVADVFMIGHGIGTIAGHYADQSQLRFVSVELDAKLVQLSREFFGYRGREVVIGDGREVLTKQPPSSLDCIIVDAFSAKGTPRQLLSLPFVELTRRQLRPSGLLLFNVGGRRQGDRLIEAMYSTLGTSYDYLEVFAPEGATADEVTNILLAASNRPISYSTAELAGFRTIPVQPGHLIYDEKE